MRSLILFLFFSGMTLLSMSQTESGLQVTTAESNVLILENTADLAPGIQTGIVFGAALNGSNPYKYTGAIKTIGTGVSEARLGLFTQAGSLPGDLIERLSILNNGNVGVGYTNTSYKFAVNGNSYFSSNVGILTAPNTSYSLAVSGSSRFYSTVRIDGVLNSTSQLNIGNNVAVAGDLTVQNGRGIVQSTSSTQMKIKRSSVGFALTNLGAGVTIDSGFLNFGENFEAVTVVVGQVVSGTGDYGKALIVPFEVDLTNNRCRFKITNVSSSAITFNASWQVVLIGN